ncbi:recombinase family protein [Sporofaciens musculi]|uniref:recombinase family protein n=1 Tax=Sporofaciens musculi TaxID=2681861 RepID=UPI0025A136FC|nr:recombinase family protein [Sporofaciens musculi]
MEFKEKSNCIKDSVYIDDGYSGTNFQRPGMQRLLEDVRNEKLSCVLVKDFSRLGRDYLEVGNLLEYIFPLMQVRFISLNDGYDSNERFGATGGMSVGLQNLVYAMYSRDLSRKVKSAKRTRQLNGEFIGSVPRYGYAKSSTERNKLVIDPAAAAVVKRIFELSAAGKSSYEICRIFNAEKVMTCAEYHKSIGHQFNLDSKNEKRLWQSSVVVGIIRDETYLGKMICNRVVKNMGTQHKTIVNDRSE